MMIKRFDKTELSFLYAFLSRKISSEWPFRNQYAEACWRKLRKVMPKSKIEYNDAWFEKETLDILLKDK